MNISKKESGKASFISVVLNAYSSALYKFDTRMRRGQAGMSEKSVRVGAFTMPYLEGGKGEPVLLLHGFGADKDNWPRFARYLTKMYRVVAPDLPGFGESTKIMSEKYTIQIQVKRVHEFVQKIGMKKFHIAGNSMGGLISGIYAATYPDDVLSLGLFDPGGVADREQSHLSQALQKGFNPLVVEKPRDYQRLLDYVFAKQPFIPGPVKTYLGKIAAGNQHLCKMVFTEENPGDQLERIMMKIRAKTLIIWGDEDRIFPVSSAEVLGKGIKNSRVVILKGCGHLPMFEQPGKTARLYLEFIK
jgi:pimeloyl-ACP methyl ester carboxylesterase